MKRKAKLVCSSLLLSLIIVLPATIRAESAVPLYDNTKKLFEQIQDLELMRRNVEECYEAEKRTPMATSRSGQSWRDHAELNRELMNRAFGYLAGTPEHQRFMREFRRLLRDQDYRRLHTDELFAEYMRLLESGRIRFLTQLKEWQESFPEKCSVQAHEALAQYIQVQTVTFGHAEGSQRSENNGRVVPAIRSQVQVPLSGPPPLVLGQRSVSRIVVHGMDQSASPGTVPPTIDIVELNTLVALERLVPLEKFRRATHYGVLKGLRLGTSTTLQFSHVFKKGVGAWDQLQRNLLGGH
jgi:hypothetical protein